MSEETKRSEGQEDDKKKSGDEPDRGGCCGGGLRAKRERINARADMAVDNIDSVLEECGKEPVPPPEENEDEA